MKKHLLNSKSLWIVPLILFFTLSSALSQTPLVNGGFENWEDVTVAFIPDDWEVEKDHETADLVNTQMSESTDGSYSLKISTILDPDDLEPLMGYAVLGEMGNEGEPIGGIPYTDEVDELRFDVKYSTEGADAVMAMVMIYDASRNIIGNEVATYTGVQDAQNDWVTETIFLSYSGIPAEILIGFTSSDYMNEANISVGSWIQIDNIKLFNEGSEITTTLPNFSFENWSDYTINDPVSWSSTNMELSEHAIANITPSLNAVEATYAAKLENLDMGEYIMTGALTYGEIPWNGTSSYSDKPEFLIGYYNYTPSEADQGGIHLSFFDDSNAPLGNALWSFGATTDYESFVLPIDYWSTNPTHHVKLDITAGETPVAGSVLLVDDFEFVNGYNVDFTVQDNNSPTPNLLENALIEITTYHPPTDLTTNINGEKSVKLPNGTYDITVSLAGYDDYTGQISVNGADIGETITMAVATGLKESPEDIVSVFPNPATNKIFVKSPEKIKKATITNLSGQIVLTLLNPVSGNEINISQLPTGQYILVIEMANETLEKKFIISR